MVSLWSRKKWRVSANKIAGAERNLRCSKLWIPWGDSHVDIHQRDLFPEEERVKMGDKPSMNLSLASINLGRLGHIKRLFGLQKHLYIVSPESSPNTSPEHSQNVSPNATFKLENQEDRRNGSSAGAEASYAS
jgi:hypothetical protein